LEKKEVLASETLVRRVKNRKDLTDQGSSLLWEKRRAGGRSSAILLCRSPLWSSREKKSSDVGDQKGMSGYNSGRWGGGGSFPVNRKGLQSQGKLGIGITSVSFKKKGGHWKEKERHSKTLLWGTRSPLNKGLEEGDRIARKGRSNGKKHSH